MLASWARQSRVGGVRDGGWPTFSMAALALGVIFCLVVLLLSVSSRCGSSGPFLANGVIGIASAFVLRDMCAVVGAFLPVLALSGGTDAMVPMLRLLEVFFNGRLVFTCIWGRTYLI